MILRDYIKEDSAIICRWLQNEEEFYKWSADRYNKYPLSDNDIDEHYSAQIDHGRFHPLTALNDDGHLVGHFIIRYPLEDDDSTVRFGFIIINPEFRGRGYAKEMVHLGIQYVRDKL